MKTIAFLLTLLSGFGLFLQSFSLPDKDGAPDIVTINAEAISQPQEKRIRCYNTVVYVGIHYNGLPMLCGECVFKPFCRPEDIDGQSWCVYP